MIKEITLHNFKRFSNIKIALLPEGITVLSGGNNSGKSSIIHALAIWEFCKLILSEERGSEALLNGYKKQGVGISAEEFLPIAIPSLNHLWTNLKTQKKNGDRDGYTLRIGCKWDSDSSADRFLEIGLSLVNDRLYIKTTDSNLTKQDKIPNVSFMPTFAGILEREPKVTFAERRKQMGKGLAGSVMRNMIYELYEKNIEERKRLRGDKSKINSSDLKLLRANDPFERLQDMLRRIFSMELKVVPFNDLYNTTLKILCYRVEFNNQTNRYARVANYSERDIMVLGNGFLQWLTIFPMALNSHIDVLLLDEPDAHLHNMLQREMLDSLRTLIPTSKKQVIFATHSTRIIKESNYETVFDTNKMKYISSDDQKATILLGLGGEYLPYIDRAKITKRIIFIEGSSDKQFLEIWAKKLGVALPDVCYIEGTESHKERFQIFQFLKKQIPELKAISLRDRDTEHENNVDIHLNTGCRFDSADFRPLTWKRRNHENYLIYPDAIARAAKAAGADVAAIRAYLIEEHSLAMATLESFTRYDASDALINVDGKVLMKKVGRQFDCNKFTVAKKMLPKEIPADVIELFQNLQEMLIT